MPNKKRVRRNATSTPSSSNFLGVFLPVMRGEEPNLERAKRRKVQPPTTTATFAPAPLSPPPSQPSPPLLSQVTSTVVISDDVSSDEMSDIGMSIDEIDQWEHEVEEQQQQQQQQQQQLTLAEQHDPEQGLLSTIKMLLPLLEDRGFVERMINQFSDALAAIETRMDKHDNEVNVLSGFVASQSETFGVEYIKQQQRDLRVNEIYEWYMEKRLKENIDDDHLFQIAIHLSEQDRKMDKMSRTIDDLQEQLQTQQLIFHQTMLQKANSRIEIDLVEVEDDEDEDL